MFKRIAQTVFHRVLPIHHTLILKSQSTHFHTLHSISYQLDLNTWNFYGVFEKQLALRFICMCCAILLIAPIASLKECFMVIWECRDLGDTKEFLHMHILCKKAESLLIKRITCKKCCSVLT